MREPSLPRLATAQVAGDSMVPALRSGDCVVILRHAGVRVGDVVVARQPDHPRLIVKRVVHRLPDGWWLESDNQRGSRDSWLFGEVPDELVLGRVLARYWPPSRARPVRRSSPACRRTR